MTNQHIPNDVASPEQYVGEIMHKVASAPPRPVHRERRDRGELLLYILIPLLLGSTVWNVARLTDRPEAFTTDEQLASIRVTVYLASQAVEAYRDSAKVLPTTLVQVTVDEPELTYHTDGSTYELSLTDEGVSVRYRPGDDVTPFEQAFSTLTQRRDAP